MLVIYKLTKKYEKLYILAQVHVFSQFRVLVLEVLTFGSKVYNVPVH